MDNKYISKIVYGEDTLHIKDAEARSSLGTKSDVVDTVTDVAYDTTDKKITKTKNSVTSDVVTVAKIKTDLLLTKSDVGLDNVTNDSQVKRSEMGVANGVATLDENGLVPSSQLPSYVDDVLEYSTFSNLPQTGEAGKIYVTTDTNITYRWSGSEYVEISKSLALGETSSTAYRGDKGKTAYNHATNKGVALTSKLYKITTNAEGHVTAGTEVVKEDITNLGIPGTDTDTVTSINGKTGAIAAEDMATVLTAAGYKLTDTNTKVTSAANHYTPTTNADSTLDVYASGGSAATWNSTNMVTGVTISRDAKGHVTDLSVDSIKLPSNPNTDTLVTQTNTTTSADYRVLLSANANDTTETTTARKSTNLKFNPSTGNLSVTKINGVSVGDSPKFTDTNTWRPVSLEGTEKLSSSGDTTLNLKAGDNVSIAYSSGGHFTFSATDTKYTAATSAPGNIASASAKGSSTNYARQDHTHGITLATGDANGQVKIAGTNVNIKGLDTAAYTSTDCYPILNATNTTSIESNTDFNDLITPKTYTCPGGNVGSAVHSSMLNSPTNGSGGGFTLYVRKLGENTPYIEQLVLMNNGKVYRRTRQSNSEWSNWANILLLDGISGVRSVATGSTNGTISVNTDGTSAEVAVAGLKSAAYKDITDSYSSTSTNAVSGKAVAAALGTLDVDSVGGTNKYIKTISETDGKISATAGAVDDTVTSGSSNLITSGAVYTAIDNLPEPMVFRGSLGTEGTITTLPTNGTASVGDTYKVITAGTYASKAADVGDTFICLTKTSKANTWELIPSGDEPSGTVTSITLNATSPIAINSTSAITTSGTRTISHANSGATVGSYGDSANLTPAYGETFKVPYVTVNATGHVTGISEHTVKIPASDNTDTKNTAGSTNSSSKLFLIGATSQAANPLTYSHDTAYVDTDGCLYSGGSKVLTSHQSLSDYATRAWVNSKFFAITDYTNINATQDNPISCNDITTYGVYGISASNTNATYVTDRPVTTAAAFRLTVERSGFSSNPYIRQRYQQYTSNDVYERYSTDTGSTWSDWVLVQRNLANYVASSELVSSFIGKLSQGTSDFTDGTDIVTSYADDNGFSGHATAIYKRPASLMWNYIRGKITADTTLTVANANYATESSSFLAGQILPANTSGDANTMQLDGAGTVYSVLTNYHSNPKWLNTPLNDFVSNYGGVVEIKGKDTALKMQLAWSAKHNEETNPTVGLWFRSRANKGYVGTDWHQVAMTDSNVASATKLQTARTLWGQSFDGTANVSGSLTDVGSITMNNSSYIYAKDVPSSGTPSNIHLFGLNASNNFLVGYGVGGSGYDTSLYGNNIYLRYGTSRVYGLTLNSSGDVGIGTTSPSEKLHVNGSVLASGYKVSGKTGFLKADGSVDSNTYLTSHQDISGKKNVLTAVSDPTASGTSLTFIKTISQNTQGVITPTKATVSTMGAASSSAAGTAGLVPAPAKGKQDSFLKGDGTWVVPTDTNTHRPIKMNGTLILGDNTTALNLKAGNNISLSNSSGTVTIAATMPTDDTYVEWGTIDCTYGEPYTSDNVVVGASGSYYVIVPITSILLTRLVGFYAYCSVLYSASITDFTNAKLTAPLTRTVIDSGKIGSKTITNSVVFKFGTTNPGVVTYVLIYARTIPSSWTS